MFSDELNDLLNEVKRKLCVQTPDELYIDDLKTLFGNNMDQFLLHAIRVNNLNRVSWALENMPHHVGRNDWCKILDFAHAHNKLSSIGMILEKMKQLGYEQIANTYLANRIGYKGMILPYNEPIKRGI